MQELLKTSDLAERFKVTESTIVKWVKGGKLPPPSIQMNQKAKYWFPHHIESFINNGGNNEDSASDSDPGLAPELQE